MESFETLTKRYINGSWVEGESGRIFNNVNPYDNSTITEINMATKDQVKQAFEVAKEAQKEWAHAPLEERLDVTRKVIDYLNTHKDEITNLISRETGGTILKA